MRFRPQQHVRRQRDFREIREKGRRHDCGGFMLWWFFRARAGSGTPGPEGSSDQNDKAPVTRNTTASTTASSAAGPTVPSGTATASSGTAAAATATAAAAIATAAASLATCHLPPAPAAPPPPPLAPPPPPRLGVVASASAVGGAVRRARAKRRLREIFRHNQHLVPPGCDILLVARRAINRLEYRALEQRFIDACRRIFKPSSDSQ
ncbi:MAG: ribonuclease P protein component [Opitutaceae bacterium]|jgi:ribonuclease P protein component|nr:ribonuclease P protein component [Opitutaceae bacterium]